MTVNYIDQISKTYEAEPLPISFAHDRRETKVRLCGAHLRAEADGDKKDFLRFSVKSKRIY
jgi:hypothetical protein